MFRLFALLSILACYVPALADEYVCTNNDTVRSISVEYEHAGWKVPCKVRYHKPTEGGATEYPWSAAATPGYCEEKAAFLAGKLENWGWQCEQYRDAESEEERN